MNKTQSLILALKQKYPKASCSLSYKNVFQLLIATILSAQCKDERVNKITPLLFKQFPNAKAMAEASITELEAIIRPLGFYHNKAISLKASALAINKDFGGKVPKEKAKLKLLRGIGEKTANIVLGSGYGIISGIAVDTHVKRLAFRLGLSAAKTPLKIEYELMQKIPKSEWIWISHALILHGRSYCKARKPLCTACPLFELCPRLGLNNKAKKR